MECGESLEKRYHHRRCYPKFVPCFPQRWDCCTAVLNAHEHQPLHLLRRELSLVDDGLGGERAEVAVILVDLVLPQLVLNHLAQDV